MTVQLYAPDAIDTWHAVANANEFAHQVRGKCGHDFKPKTPSAAKRPHKDKYCAGCLGVEEREAKRTPTHTSPDPSKTRATAPPSDLNQSIAPWYKPSG